VANRTKLERNINRKYVTKWPVNLKIKKKAVNIFGYSSEASGYTNCGGLRK
jgi:hypothetical protein